MIQEVSKDLAESLGLAKPMGQFNSVEKGGPADRAGIEPGDVILKFDGKQINASADLPRMVGATRPGTRSTVQLWRKGTTRDIAVIVGEMATRRPPEAARDRAARCRNRRPTGSDWWSAN